jgi:hypothetical protein
MTKTEALKLALEALEYHTAQTRPIIETMTAIAAIKEALAQPDLVTKEVSLPEQERNFCSRCGKRLLGPLGPVSIHTCTPPNARTFDDYGNKIV